MLGIFIGIASVVALIGLGEGLRTAITSQFGILGSDVLSVQASGLRGAGPPGSGVANRLTDDLAEKIDKIPGVEIAINRHLKTGSLEFNDIIDIGVAVSVPVGDNRKTFENMMNLQAAQGRLLTDSDTRKVFLGHGFTNGQNWGGKGIKSGDRVLLNDLPYEVVGIMNKRGSFMLDNAVFVNEDQLLEDLGDDGTVDLIGVKVKDEKEIDRVKADVEKLMRKERKVKEGEEDFEVRAPQATLEALDSTLFAVQLFITVIAGISLLVGGIGITNTMYTSVLERTKEIGIMKSIGARNSSIFTLFFIESGLLGLVGGIIGVLIGLMLAYGLAAAGRAALGGELIQASVSMSLVFGALAFSFGVGLTAGLTPAIKAAKKHPVDALRFAK